MRDEVVGEDGRDDVGDVALGIVHVVGLPLARLADHHTPVQVGVLSVPAAVLIDGQGTEELRRVGRYVQVAFLGGVHAGSNVFAVGHGYLLAVRLPMGTGLILFGGL